MKSVDYAFMNQVNDDRDIRLTWQRVYEEQDDLQRNAEAKRVNNILWEEHKRNVFYISTLVTIVILAGFIDTVLSILL